MTLIGIIVNPSSGKDIRRLVAEAAGKNEKKGKKKEGKSNSIPFGGAPGGPGETWGVIGQARVPVCNYEILTSLFGYKTNYHSLLGKETSVSNSFETLRPSSGVPLGSITNRSGRLVYSCRSPISA